MAKHIKSNLTVYILFVFFSLIILSIVFNGWTFTWNKLKIHTLLPPHFDFRFYQYPAIAISKGNNPLFATHESWAGLKFFMHGMPNYYLPFFKFSHFLNFHKELYFLSYAILIIFSYLLCVLSLLKKKKNSFWILILFFSGSSLLGIERTNNDLIIFILIYLSAMFPNFIGVSFIMLSTYIEFWPLFSAIGFIKKKIKILFLPFSIIFIFIFHKTIFSPLLEPIIDEWASFGAKSLSLTIKTTFNLNISYFAVVGTLVILTFFTLMIGSFKLDHKKKPSEFEERLFLIGSTLYVTLYIFSSNYDYKLIFLIFCIPYLSLLKNIPTKWFILLNIIVASNYFLIVYSLGDAGHYINIISKVTIFIILLNILIRYFIYFIKNFGIKKIFL